MTFFRRLFSLPSVCILLLLLVASICNAHAPDILVWFLFIGIISCSQREISYEFTLIWVELNGIEWNNMFHTRKGAGYRLSKSSNRLKVIPIFNAPKIPHMLGGDRFRSFKKLWTCPSICRLDFLWDIQSLEFLHLLRNLPNFFKINYLHQMPIS